LKLITADHDIHITISISY